MCIIDLSLLHLKRASETQNHHLMDTQAPRDRRGLSVKLVLVSFTLINTHCQHLVLSSSINVCVGYMCFVKL